MKYVALLILAAAVFAVCYGLDKGFSRLFRSKPQHKSGLSVKLSKFYALAGLFLILLGVVALISGITHTYLALVAGGVIAMLLGVGLLVYYLTFGVYYNEETFLVSGLGKATKEYRFCQITGQQLYNAGGKIVIELHLATGEAVLLQQGMEGVYPFLDAAFAAWLKQTGRKKEECDFYDPSQSCWFPKVGQ